MEYVQVLTTTGSKKDAERIAEKLLENKLAACIQVSPISSIYRWKGKTEKGKEYLCIIKSQKKLYKKIETTIKTIHPYEVPEIISVAVSCGSKRYLAWIEEETT